MFVNNFIEYTLSLGLINDKRISERTKFLIENKSDIAALSVAPAFVGIVGVESYGRDIAISAKLNSNTYFEVQMLECAMALENGADEIEIILVSGEIIDGEFDKIIGELTILKTEFEPETAMKVDIHFDKLSSEQTIRDVICAIIKGGADFIVLNLEALNNSHLSIALEQIKTKSLKYSHQIGVKFKNAEDEEFVLKQVNSILGSEWLTSEFLRFEREVI